MKKNVYCLFLFAELVVDLGEPKMAVSGGNAGAVLFGEIAIKLRASSSFPSLSFACASANFERAATSGTLLLDSSVNSVMPLGRSTSKRFEAMK